MCLKFWEVRWIFYHIIWAQHWSVSPGDGGDSEAAAGPYLETQQSPWNSAWGRGFLVEAKAIWIFHWNLVQSAESSQSFTLPKQEGRDKGIQGQRCWAVLLLINVCRGKSCLSPLFTSACSPHPAPREFSISVPPGFAAPLCPCEPQAICPSLVPSHTFNIK